MKRVHYFRPDTCETRPSRALKMGVMALLILGTSLRAEPVPKYERALDLPPRLQWNANSGYCGETSFISAGLYYGQYCSQYEARSLASPGVPQSDPDSQLLLGVNDVPAAAAMRLKALPWNTSQQTRTREFLVWAKSQLLAGYPVIIGVFTNEYLFYGETDRDAGDGEYDHIVPVCKIGSDRPLDSSSSRYLASDVITFSDNGLWSPTDTPPYLFSYRFGEFQKNRRQANGRRGPIYSLNKDGQNYGIAITGVVDHDGHAIPVRLETSVNYEKPEMVDGSDTPPAPMSLELTATVKIPDPTVAHTLYRYDNFADVPESNFNANAGNAVECWQIPANSGTEFVVKKTILSNETVAFRAVPASAP